MVDSGIVLTKGQIDAALPRVKPGLAKYLAIQARRDACDIRTDRDFQRRFNGFYRVRRGRPWQDQFYAVLDSMKGKGSRATYGEVLRALHQATGRYEASFASKLLATIDPEMPVIDSIVLKNLNLRLPVRGTNRLERLEALHGSLARMFRAFLAADEGRYLAERFRAAYPDAAITAVKMLDLVLWQTRAERRR